MAQRFEKDVNNYSTFNSKLKYMQWVLLELEANTQNLKEKIRLNFPMLFCIYTLPTLH